MLTNTFSHIPGIGLITEKRLWESGTRSWDDFVNEVLKLSEEELTHKEELKRQGQRSFICQRFDLLFGVLPTWHLLEGLLPEDEMRSQEKQTRKEKSSVMQGNLCGEGAQPPSPCGLDMAMKPTGRANSTGA